VTTAYFQVSGKQPSKNKTLKMWHSGVAIVLDIFKKDIRDAVVSAGSARLQLKQDTSNDIRHKSNGIQDVINNTILDIRAQSIVYCKYTSENLLKTSAFMLGSVVILPSSIFRPAEVT